MIDTWLTMLGSAQQEGQVIGMREKWRDLQGKLRNRNRIRNLEIERRREAPPPPRPPPMQPVEVDGTGIV
jgi:PHS family inorganic phosphate transporter-like MFS transporter